MENEQASSTHRTFSASGLVKTNSNWAGFNGVVLYNFRAGLAVDQFGWILP